MNNREQENDWLTVDDLLWALGLEPKSDKPVKADAPDKAELLDECDEAVEAEEAVEPNESDRTPLDEAVVSDEAVSSPEAFSLLVGASDDETTPDPLPNIPESLSEMAATSGEPSLSPDSGSSAALMSKLFSNAADLSQNSVPAEFPSSEHSPNAVEEHPRPLASSHGEVSTQPQLIPSADATAPLPTHRNVSATAPSHQAVTAKKAAWTVLEKSTRTNADSHSHVRRNDDHLEGSLLRTNADSQLATAFEPTTEMPPILFPEKPAKVGKHDRESRQGEPAVHFQHESPQMVVDSKDGTMLTKEEETPVDDKKAAPEESPSRIQMTSKNTTSRVCVWMLIASAILCLIAILSLVLTFAASGNQEAQSTEGTTSSTSAQGNAEWITYHYTMTCSDGTSYSTTEVATFDASDALIGSLAVVECKDAAQAKAFLSQAEKDYGDILVMSDVCDKTVLLRLDTRMDASQGELSRDIYSKMLMTTKGDCQVVLEG